MLGLSLAIRVGKRVLGGLIDSLMSAVKGRSTYSENIADSKQVVKDIDNYELLDKASILLTPTAYSDARVHSVKTYIGDEFVINGGFSDGINDWTNNASATLSTENDKLKVSVSGAGSGYGQQNIIGLTIGATYKISAEGEIGTSTRLALYTPNAGFNNLYSDGAISTFFSATSTTENLRLYVYDDGAYGFWDNISIVDVSSDFDFDRASSATRINSDGLVQDMQSITDPELVLNGDFEELGGELVTNGTFDTDSDWSLGTGWSIGDGVAVSDGTNNADILQSGSVVGKNYKLTFTITENNAGRLSVYIGGLYVGHTGTGNSGDFTFYGVATDTTLIRFRSALDFDGSIDNVSVQQVDPNDRWSLGTSWSIEDGVAASDGSGSYLTSSSTLTSGNTYRVSLEITEYNGGSVSLPFDGAGANTNYQNSVGVKTADIIAENNSPIYIYSSGFDGKIDNISVKDITFSEDVDLARINYDSNGENGHWLLEPTSTNLIPYSEDFSQWSNARTTDTSNQATSPDGTNNATYFEQNSGETTAGSVYVSSIISSGTNTLSVFAKKKEKDFIVLYDTNAARTYFDLNNGSVGTTPSGVTANIENYGNGWYRCLVTFTVSSSGAQNTAFYLADNDSAAPIADSGGIYIWGAQLEALSYATSYIPTYGSTVTRATETLRNSGNSTLINSTEGVLYVEALMQDTGAFKTAARITATDTSTTDGLWIYFRNDNSIQSVLRVGGVDQTGINSSVKTTNEYYKVAFKYKENDFALWVDGVEVATDTSGNTFSAGTLSNLGFVLATNTNPFYGKVKALAVFDESLTDDELELLTGITNYGSFNELAQANGYTII